MKYLVIFIMTFILFLLVYYFIYVRKARRTGRCPAEGNYLIRLYGLDIEKFSYRRFLLLLSIVVSLDIAIVATVITVFDKLIWEILFGVITIIPVIAISFTLLGKYYQKKQLKDNSKELLKEEKWINRQEKKKEYISSLFRIGKRGNNNDKRK